MCQNSLKVDYCSYEAAKWAVMYWHYSKKMPVGKLVKIGCWENQKFIGCIIFSHTVGPNVTDRFELNNFTMCELVRVALKYHINHVTKMLSIAIKLLKKHCPKLECIISMADPLQNHLGIIYQASNWLYIGKTGKTLYYLYPDGRLIHSRVANPNNIQFGSRSKNYDLTGSKKIYTKGKFCYLYPLSRPAKRRYIQMIKPYPKEINADA